MLTITEGDGDPEIVSAGYVSGSMFSVLRTPPLLGRTLLPEDDGAEPTRVFVLSYEFWQRRFGGDSSVIGQTLAGGVEVESFGAVGEIVGVMPEGFAFPSDDIQVWTQLPLDPARTWRGGHWFYMIARLADGVSYEQAEVDMETIMADWEVRYPDHHTGHFLFLKLLLDDYIANVRPALLLLFGAVGFVLLIACANVANVLLARGEGRRREIAVRSALGATRGRLVQQLVTESLLLGCMGGAIGVILASIAVPALLALEGGGIPRVDQVSMDGRVLAFTAVLVLLTALVFSLVPTLQGAASKVTDAFQDRATSTTAGKQRLRFRAFLIIAEMALAILLVIGAGLMAKSFWHLLSEDPGFRTDNLLTAYFSLPAPSYSGEQAMEFYDRLTEEVEALPGVENAALVSRTPVAVDWHQGRFHIEEQEQAEEEQFCCSASHVWAGPGIFRTLGSTLVSGRVFDETDGAEAAKVIVIDETLARTYWPGEDPIGKRITTTFDEYATIVGVVRHMQFDGLGTSYPTLYEPYLQMRDHFVRSMVLAVRTSVYPTGVAGPIREVVRSLDPNVPIVYMRTMDTVLTRAVARPRFTMTLLGLFAGVALLLGIIGVYGVMSHAVAARTNEIGIRIALGARSGEVIQMVARQGFVLAMTGVAVGLASAVIATRVMEGLLFNVSATDPWTFGAVAILMAMVALLASYLPARRASNVDPIEALRVE
jgi:putative ABC transport system permease protein